MKVRDLIDKLKECDMDAEVLHLWDGATRTSIEHVYMSRSGDCVTADYGMVVYSDDSRPVDAPTVQEYKYWETPKKDA